MQSHSLQLGRCGEVVKGWFPFQGVGNIKHYEVTKQTTLK